MGVFEIIGIVVLILLAGLLAIFVRREVISRRGGTIDMNMRLSALVRERGWAPGLGRFAGDELRWYRMFSLGLRPRRVLSRDGLVVENRRAPQGAERLAMPPGWVVIRCSGGSNGGRSPVATEIALAESALMGFLSWLEAAPPGALRRR
jgi:Protein of unknown function (DUF2550)